MYNELFNTLKDCVSHGGWNMINKDEYCIISKSIFSTLCYMFYIWSDGEGYWDLINELYNSIPEASRPPLEEFENAISENMVI